MNKKLYIEDELMAGRRIPDEHRRLFTEIDVLYHRLTEVQRHKILWNIFSGDKRMLAVVAKYSVKGGEQEKFLRTFLSSPAASRYKNVFIKIMEGRVRRSEDAVYEQLCSFLGKDLTVGMCFQLEKRYIALSDSHHSFTSNTACRYVFIDGSRASPNKPTSMTYKVMLENLLEGRMRLLSKKEESQLKREGIIEDAVEAIKKRTRKRRQILFGKD